MSNKKTYNSWQKDTVYEKCNGRCAICGKELSQENMTIAHRIPLSRGGDNSIDNLMLACWECSHIKNNLTMEEFFQKIKIILEHNNLSEREKP